MEVKKHGARSREQGGKDRDQREDVRGKMSERGTITEHGV